jgi:nitrite reductase/ring-hydroxylating ferredoxin subunit
MVVKEAGMVTEWVEVAALRELRRRKKLMVTAGEEQIALFFVDDEVFALRDICIHKQRNLSKGLIFQGQVICPGHQWAFDLATGWNDEWGRCQPCYPVKVEDDKVYVRPEQQVRETAPAPEELHPARR